MSDRRLTTFEDADLQKWFDRLKFEPFVQRGLRAVGFDSVKDVLCLNELELHEHLTRQTPQVQRAATLLHRNLKVERDRIAREIELARKPDVVKPPLQILPAAVPEISVTPTGAAETPKSTTLRAVRQNAQDAGPGPEKVPLHQSASGQASSTSSSIHEHPITETDQDHPPMELGEVFRRDKFLTSSPTASIQNLPMDESGLRLHAFIVGSSGSGKTVAARFILEQCAIRDIPSIVIDAQGDLSSLVLSCEAPSESAFFDELSRLSPPESKSMEQNYRESIRNHLAAIKRHPVNYSNMYWARAHPRIFTPRRPDLGLGLAIPPFIDILSTFGEEAAGDFKAELDDLLLSEIRNLVRTVLPSIRRDEEEEYVQLSIIVFRHAHEVGLVLEGERGIKNLHDLLEQSPSLFANRISKYLTPKALTKICQAINQLQFEANRPWLQGAPLDIAAMRQPGPGGKTPINVININDLNYNDKQRVLRHVIAAVYKYALANPVPSGVPPSLVLYIDEISTGYGEKSIGRPDQSADYNVFGVLNQLVRQARKYGVSVVLASQRYTDLYPGIRGQLQTKIVGRVGDTSEQNRVQAEISDDLLKTHKMDPGEFVAKVLPGLSQPEMLYIGESGLAETYKQQKCCTLDFTLNAQAVKRWREEYLKEAISILDLTEGYLGQCQFESAEDALSSAAAFAMFVPGTSTRLTACRLRVFIGRRRLPEAMEFLRSLDDSEWTPQLADMAEALAAEFARTDCPEVARASLELALKIARKVNPIAAEKIALGIARESITSGRLNESSSELFLELRNSKDQGTRVFGEIWMAVIGRFGKWKAALSFLVSGAGPARLVTSSPEKDAVEVCELPFGEHSAGRPTIFRSQIRQGQATSVASMMSGSSPAPHKPRSLSYEDGLRLLKQQEYEIARVRRVLQEQGIRAGLNALKGFQTQAGSPPLPKDLVDVFDAHPDCRRELILDWLENLHWREFELEIASMFVRLGYNAWATKASGDGGVDVRAVKGEETVVVQCKRWNNRVGIDPVRALGAVRVDERASRAVMVTSSELEPGAREWARTHDIEVIERYQLVELFLQQLSTSDMISRNDSAGQADATHLAGLAEQDQISFLSDGTESRRVDEKDKKIIALFAKRREIRNVHVQDALGISGGYASQRLKKLVDLGIIRMNGTRATAYYTVVKRP